MVVVEPRFARLRQILWWRESVGVLLLVEGGQARFLSTVPRRIEEMLDVEVLRSAAVIEIATLN